MAMDVLVEVWSGPIVDWVFAAAKTVFAVATIFFATSNFESKDFQSDSAESSFSAADFESFEGFAFVDGFTEFQNFNFPAPRFATFETQGFSTEFFENFDTKFESFQTA